VALTAHPFGDAYADAFARYLAATDERALRAAYELGRDAVERELSVLDLAVAHHEALLAALASTDRASVERITRSAADFFVESLSALEMVRRGFREARDAALAERRQAALLRQLSSFLADASLAAGGHASYSELLQLVAEQAIELIDAEYCLVVASLDEEPRSVAFAMHGEGPHSVPPWLSAAAGRPDARSDTSGGDPVATKEGGASGQPRNALSAALTTLDGREVGTVRLFNRRAGEFGEVDDALLVHLAQLAAAALERMQLYANCMER
jgi:GAF domain-containing protein